MLSGTAAIALAALLSVAPGVAGADTATGTDTQTQAETTTTTDTQAQPVTDAAEGEEVEAATEAEVAAQAGVDAADLMGDSVENAAGDVLGDIETMVVAPDGTIEHVILGVGGFLGIGEKEVAVPWDRFTVDPAENRIVADVSREELEGMPDFEWPDNYETGTLLSPTGQTASTDMTTSADTSDEALTDDDAVTDEQTAADTTAEEQPMLQPLDSMLAGNVIGAQIIDANGDEIGEVDDVVISADGTAQGVVTEVGGFLGIDEKQVLISWSDIDVRQDEDGDVVLQVELDAAALESMPNYEATASN